MDTKETTDIYFTSAMLALGAKLENVDRSDPRHMVFTISKEPIPFRSEPLASAVISGGATTNINLEHYEKEWANGVLMINAVQFKDAIQRMKSIIHTKS